MTKSSDSPVEWLLQTLQDFGDSNTVSVQSKNRISVNHGFRGRRRGGTTMLRDEDLAMNVGRCESGSFINLVHTPTRISRWISSPWGRSSAEILRDFRHEIEEELLEKGLTQYVRTCVPDEE